MESNPVLERSSSQGATSSIRNQRQPPVRSIYGTDTEARTLDCQDLSYHLIVLEVEVSHNRFEVSSIRT